MVYEIWRIDMKIGGIYLVSDNNSFGIVDFGDETMEIGWPEFG